MSRSDNNNNNQEEEEEEERGFHIEQFKHKVVADPNKTWKILEDAILEICNGNVSSLGFEELYRTAYNMVLHKFGDKLYTGLEATLTHHLNLMSTSIEAAQGRLFLEELNNKWTNHNKALQIIREIFMYMDRTYIPNTRKTSVHELGLNLWRDNIIHSSTIRTRLLETLLEEIRLERAGEVINRGIMRNVIKMLTDLGPSVYHEDFEKPFLDLSTDFYRVESQGLIECCDCGAYLKIAERRLNEEIERVSKYLSEGSKIKITTVVLKEMILNHLEKLVFMKNSGLANMIIDDKYEDLRRMYNLFGHIINALLFMIRVMVSHLKPLVTDPEKLKFPVKFVNCFLNDKDKYDKIINLAFNNDKRFQFYINIYFGYFLNLNPGSAEFISLFVDDKLRKGFKKVSEEDVEIILDKVMILFRYLHDKDVFEKYYKQHLAKRLLSGKTVSDDAERSLVVKLKMECGSQFTSKLEGMLKDMKTSQDTMQGFYETHGADLGGGPTLVVQVLTSGSWPTQPSATCNLPTEISALCEKFRSYYIGTHRGRRLTWQKNMGTADLKVSFENGQKNELNVSTYQMCVLMLFNDSDQLSYNEIERATEIPPLDLKRCLQSLALVKGKNVLKKVPMSKDVGEDDAFSVNENFRSKFYKIKIGTVAAHKESETEKEEIPNVLDHNSIDVIKQQIEAAIARIMKSRNILDHNALVDEVIKQLQPRFLVNTETRARVEEDRKPQIEGAILRIMRYRKVLDHNALIAEVIRQLQPRFIARTEGIKKGIESLIERECLERDSLDKRLYRYLA